MKIPFTSNIREVSDLHTDRGYVVSLLVLAVVAAPICEEIVFRGVMLRGLLSRNGAVVAVGVQGVLFGLAHFDPIRGTGNIGLILVLASVGCVLGGAAYLIRRIGSDDDRPRHHQRRRDGARPQRLAHRPLTTLPQLSHQVGRVRSVGVRRGRLSIRRTSPNQTAATMIAGCLTTATGSSVSGSTISRYSSRARGSAAIRARRQCDQRPRRRARPGDGIGNERASACDHAHRGLAIVGTSRALRLEIASPSGSRTVGTLDDLDVHVEVGDHPPDDRQLLKVLATEHGDVGLDRAEQLGHHGGDAAEVPGPPRTLQRRRPARPARRGSGSPRGYIAAAVGAYTASTPRSAARLDIVVDRPRVVRRSRRRG